MNSETDFVARNDQFQAFAREAAKIALMGDGTLGVARDGAFPRFADHGQGSPAGADRDDRREHDPAPHRQLEISKGVIATYVHNAVSEGLGKIGVLVALESEGDVTALSTLGRQIAMHVAATNPLAVDASGIDAATVERESAILREKNAGKPDNVMQKIVESGLKSYYKEVTLLEQSFVHDPSKTVAQVLKEAESKAGKPVTLKAFVRYALGEGIEKEEAPDFAAEVAAAAGEGLRLSNGGLRPPFPYAGSCKNGMSAVTKIVSSACSVKLSGEALTAPDGYWLDPHTLFRALAAGSRPTRPAPGFEIALVIGGGNIIRGARMSAAGWIDRPTADSMGMLGTAMNSLALETALNAAGVLGPHDVGRLDAVDLRNLCPPAGAPPSRERAGHRARRRHRATRSSRPTPRPSCGRRSCIATRC